MLKTKATIQEHVLCEEMDLPGTRELGVNPTS